MLRTTLASSRILRACIVGVVTTTAAVIFTNDAADARHSRHRHYARHHQEARESYNPALSSIMVDGNSPATTARPEPPSGFAHQDHDALSAVRAPRCRQDEARRRNERLRARLGPGS